MVDDDPEAREVALRNFPETPFLLADVHQLSGNEIRRRAGLKPDEIVHVLLGGPPCQGFSYLGKRALEDERNALVLDYFRLVKELKPLVCLMENVPLIITALDGAFIGEICDALSELGYSASADIVVASDYGVPQLRKRAIVIGYRSELALVPQFPLRTHERVTAAALTNANGRVVFEKDKLPYVSVEEAIGDLPPLKASEGEDLSFYSLEPTNSYQTWARTGSLAVFNHRSRAHGTKYLDKISVIKEGGCPKCYREPGTNKKYWTMKVERNRQRDEKVDRLCRESGWTVVRFWEHEVMSDPGKVVVKLLNIFSKADK